MNVIADRIKAILDEMEAVNNETGFVKFAFTSDKISEFIFDARYAANMLEAWSNAEQNRFDQFACATLTGMWANKEWIGCCRKRAQDTATPLEGLLAKLAYEQATAMEDTRTVLHARMKAEQENPMQEIRCTCHPAPTGTSASCPIHGISFTAQPPSWQRDPCVCANSPGDNPLCIVHSVRPSSVAYGNVERPEQCQCIAVYGDSPFCPVHGKSE